MTRAPPIPVRCGYSQDMACYVLWRRVRRILQAASPREDQPPARLCVYKHVRLYRGRVCVRRREKTLATKRTHVSPLPSDVDDVPSDDDALGIRTRKQTSRRRDTKRHPPSYRPDEVPRCTDHAQSSVIIQPYCSPLCHTRHTTLHPAMLSHCHWRHGANCRHGVTPWQKDNDGG